MWRLQTWKSYWALWLTPPSCRHLLHGTPDSERMKGTCLLWMSLWSHISAHPRLSDGRRGRVIRPSRAEPHLHTLNAPTQRLDKPLQRFTRWLSSRAPSTRCLYALKWSVFSTWCQDRDLDPVTSDVSVVLSFLHETPRPRTVPPWDLPTVLRALKVPPFEPLQSTSLRALSLKNVLLLALSSIKWVGDLQALSINPACLEFGPNDARVVLKARLGYVSKELSTPFRAQIIALSALPPRRVAGNCPCSALSGPWGYTLSVLLHTGNQNSFLLASVTAPMGALLRSKEFLGG